MILGPLIPTPTEGVRLGEGLSAKPSKALVPGMVVELRHSTGKACAASSGVCDQAKAHLLVVDAGGGYIGLLGGSQPYSGAVPLKARLMAIDAGSNGEHPPTIS